MLYTEMERRCADGTRMFGCQWLPDGGAAAARAVVGIVHGMGEHAGRYAHVAEALTAGGCAVLMFDQRGHGRTEGKRGHAPFYDALLEGVDWLLEEAERRFPALPRFLYGHSMGGNVTVNYVLRRKPRLNGAVVTGPWLKLAFQPPKLQAVIGRVVERFYPRYTNARPLAAEKLTSDPDMVRRYVEDPLGHGQITAGFFFGVQRAGLWAIAHAHELTVPLLLLHGGVDHVTSIHASRRFAENAGGLCSFREWPGFLHELHNERGRDEVFASILQWIDERIAER
ncbi:alpha/beta hydrolase [Paenibacillus humicola]|uniref:alpha/beta hydrolase n=1 Tax=Paenibacillus humicola TaxID=3110540 RepID=UPI00237A85B6|nr:alpha/beta hydrolase [Paenibacillus humicola]